MAVRVDFLKSLPYFAGLEPNVLDAVRRRVYEKKAEKGEMLAFEGEKSDVLYFVVSGVVKVFKTSADGKEQIFRIIRPGESFNDVPVLGGGLNLVSAAAMVEVTLYAIKKSDLEAVMREHPQVAFNVIRVLSRRVTELISLVEDLSFRHVTSRLAKILLMQVEEAGKGRSLHLTQQDLASMVGTAREVVVRSLRSMEEQGILKRERHQLVILDIEALWRLA